MIYKRYLVSEILKSASGVFILVSIIFACDCAINYLGEVIEGLLPPAMVGWLILLRVGIAMEVILPVTLFLAVIIALGRLYKDSEMTALSACGIGMPRVLALIGALALPVALVAAYASLGFRPEAWSKIYRVTDEAEHQFDISRLNPNAFLELRSGKVVFFAQEVNDGDHSAQGVFVHIAEGPKRQVIRAQQMRQSENEDGRRMLVFRHGSMYEIPPPGESIKTARFEEANYALPTENAANPRYRRKATPTERLVGSSRLEDRAELQWRLSAPLSTVLLALLGVPLSKSSPRQGKFARIGIAILVFALYFQLYVIARAWVSRGMASPELGIWWVPALLLGFTLLMLWRSGEVFYRRRP